ncbi:NACHT domain-containing protein [Solihabitans fulvus]|uniref:NACHT domain-containing protein n=1 Tax=Solihabitans fulvus TaxID=1892852 RepID=A0A5B2XF90_9PSEU|nr:NACHT domain-containing protein [Solihabitans fulvus]KAA2261580.1 NACHT domain-containing protein [Solihabitans fulvus]
MSVGRRGARTAVAVACALAAGILWTVQAVAPSYVAVTASSVASVTAIVAIFASRLARDQPVHLDDLLDLTAGNLTAALVEQWGREETVRAHTPVALPVRCVVVSDPARPGGAFDDVVGLLTGGDSPRRLVVLGGVGAGKSALVLRLALALLRVRGDAEPVPVLMSAGSWNPRQTLDDWVAGQLVEQYPELGVLVPTMGGAPRTLASALVARRRVLPIVDGLDELESVNRAPAFRQLETAARRDQPLIVTCRTEEYRELLDQPDQEPLEHTPVIELSPVRPADVRAYLVDATAPPASRWDPLFEHLDAEPDGVLADVLSSPLMVWLARMVYQRRRTDPAELVALAPNRDDVTGHLLDGLVPAAYAERSRLTRSPERVGESLEPARRALVALARHLRAGDRQNLAWWRLHEQVPSVLVGLSTALATGGVLGLAVLIAVADRYGPRVGLVVGAADAVAAGALCWVTVLIPKVVPRTLNFRVDLSRLGFKPLGGLAAGLAVGLSFGHACTQAGGPLAGVVVFLAVTPVSALAVGSVFGPVVGATGGTSAGLAIGLAAALVPHRSSGVLEGIVLGAVFTVMGWLWTGLYEPAKTPRAVSPDSLYRGDRTSSLVVGLTSGAVYGLAYTLALGPWIGALATVVLAFAVTITVSSWGQSAVASVWRPLCRAGPRDVMGLLREAHERGVIRQNGIYYQFRHDLLKERLASDAEPDALGALTVMPASPPAS